MSVRGPHLRIVTRRGARNGMAQSGRQVAQRLETDGILCHTCQSFFLHFCNLDKVLQGNVPSRSPRWTTISPLWTAYITPYLTLMLINTAALKWLTKPWLGTWRPYLPVSKSNKTSGLSDWTLRWSLAIGNLSKTKLGEYSKINLCHYTWLSFGIFVPSTIQITSKYFLQCGYFCSFLHSDLQVGPERRI